jgi:hypothetical protein
MTEKTGEKQKQEKGFGQTINSKLKKEFRDAGVIAVRGLDFKNHEAVGREALVAIKQWQAKPGRPEKS